MRTIAGALYYTVLASLLIDVQTRLTFFSGINTAIAGALPGLKEN
jgi:hypothetical protein